MTRPYMFILDASGNPVAVHDTIKWGEWFKTGNRTVGRDQVGPFLVSTVFLGIDHNYTFVGEPLLFETMVLMTGDWDDIAVARYATREQATIGHQAAVTKALALIH